MSKAIDTMLGSGKVKQVWSERGHRSNGRCCWWAAAAPGWCNPELEGHGAHQDTQTELLREVRGFVRCGCVSCAPLNIDQDTSRCRCRKD